FIYRYVPAHPGDLHNGKLQVLQVLNAASQPITVASQTALNAPDEVALHTYGKTFDTKWVTIHDTATDGTTPFNANLAAKAKNGTPFKRPENGVFRPGTRFGEFYFDETGDTNATSVENDTAGDGLHTQRNALDSGFLFNVNQVGADPIRWLAEGRDPSATLDSANGGFGKNEGDNEITGIHVSDGDPSVNGILGA